MKRILLLFLCMTLVAFNCFASPEYKMVKSQGDVLGRWLEIESIIEYNETGDLVYEFSNYDGLEYSNGEKWYTYENGKLVYTREECTVRNEVSETRFDYDDNENLIHEKTTIKSNISSYSSRESEIWYEYDKDGNEIHSKASFGIETWKTYNDKGVLIQEKRLDDGILTDLFEYNDQGKEIHSYLSSEDYFLETYHEFDQDNRLIYSKGIFNDNVTESYYEYDDKGLLKSRTSSDGSFVKYEYDIEGRKIKISSSIYGETFYEYDGDNLIHEFNELYERFREFDKNNNITYYYYKPVNGETNEKWTEYEYWDNDSIKKKIVYRRI